MKCFLSVQVLTAKDKICLFHGIWQENFTGLYEQNGEIHYIVNGQPHVGSKLIYVDGYYYYFNSADWSAVKGRKYWISKTRQNTSRR